MTFSPFASVGRYGSGCVETAGFHAPTSAAVARQFRAAQLISLVASFNATLLQLLTSLFLTARQSEPLNVRDLSSEGSEPNCRRLREPGRFLLRVYDREHRLTWRMARKIRTFQFWLPASPVVPLIGLFIRMPAQVRWI